MVEMTFVQSSNVESIGYDPVAMELHVRYLSSPTVYVYTGVPDLIYDALMAAPSKGSFIGREVKGTYPFEKR